jgi:lipopolysaccharide/colanic/teichoic acid biosynthesis glycosyltransferase
MIILKIITAIILTAACIGVVAQLMDLFAKTNGHQAYGPYERFFKRFLDAFLSTGAVIVLSPILLILIILGAIEMKGNPFYIQKRPGKRDSRTGQEKIMKLIKFRSMTNEKDANGKLLPDKDRLNKYGRIIRATSLDELPSLINIVKGDISVVGPRPLAVLYLKYYTEEERHRHDVRPGLTGLAQVNGRNNLSWDKKFAYDLKYVSHITFMGDLRILLQTVKKVFVHEGIGQGEEMPVSLHVERKDWQLTDGGAIRPTEARV